ncbi:hypothetical protein HZH66_005863 [Vespula vulgaris]|uniref:Uncharacterized protein n=1 Tax=Vespula vulgaris TaxID=7454 RepID=A0A834K988_VESVU|nr:hypothetical protein HZH66_005863 [Vespula vulgaris]
MVALRCSQLYGIPLPEEVLSCAPYKTGESASRPSRLPHSTTATGAQPWIRCVIMKTILSRTLIVAVILGTGVVGYPPQERLMPGKLRIVRDL